MKMTIPQHETIDADWRQWAERVQADLEALNEQLNDAAEERDLCGEYEAVLDDFNHSTRTFTMEGRPRRFRVDVNVALYVTAKDDDAAESVARAVMDKFASGRGDSWIRENVASAGDASYEAGDFHISET